MRYLGQEAGAVARVFLAAGRATMLEIQEDLQRLPDDVVRSARFQIDDESESARVVLERGVVETLSRGEVGAGHLTYPCGPVGIFRTRRTVVTAARRVVSSGPARKIVFIRES